MSETLKDILANAISLGLLDPKLWLLSGIATTIIEEWHDDPTVRVINNKLVAHVHRVTSKDISPQERSELEIRIHELLGILVQIGKLS